MAVQHHFSVDVEEFFHASALEGHVPRTEWDQYPRHSPSLVDRMLRRMEKAGIKGTFFILGWLAKREPEMVRAITAAGHEVASHGWDHRRVNTLTPAEFREDVRRSKKVLQQLTGKPVLGYRAPSFSILPGFEWALDILVEEDFKYDSSLFPISIHPKYGYPTGKRDPHVLSRPAGKLIEIPPVTLRLGPLNFPAAGGAYLRFFPLGLIRRALKSAEARGVPGTVYSHPWELDEDMPAFEAPWGTQQRMRRGVRGVGRKLSTLASMFPFRPMVELAQEVSDSLSRGDAV